MTFTGGVQHRDITDGPVDDLTCRKDAEMTTSTNDTHGAEESTSRRSIHRGVAAGLAVGVLGGTAAGLVFGVPGLTSASSSSPAAVVAQTDEPAPVDEAPGADDERPEPGTRLREVLQPLVDDGTITAEQADAVTATLVEARPERGEGGFGHGPGGHRGGPGGMFGRGGPGIGSEALTDLLGLEAGELRDQLRDGATLAEIATAQGIEVQAVVDTLVAELTERLDAAVADGRIEQSDADDKLADATEKITEMVNNGRPD
jgi:hypothetical protein